VRRLPEREHPDGPAVTPEVIFFCDSFLPPSEVFMVEQARNLARYDPKFVVARAHDSKSARASTMRVERLTASLAGRRAILALKMFRQVDPFFRRVMKSCALLHAQFGKNGYVAWPVARKLNIPFVTTFHGYDATFAGNPRTVEGFNQRKFFRHGRAQMADAGLNCVAVSNYIRTKLIELGFPEQAVFRHYIGIDTKLFSPASNVERVKGRVVSVARFVEYKGHRFLIEALERLAKGGIPVELVMVGQGPLRDVIEREARQRLPKVVVLGDQSQDEILKLHRSAQLYVHGSYRTSTGHAEALGLSILEAQAVGTPVVAFDSGGVGEAIQSGKSGYLVPEKDVGGMSAMAAALLTDPDRWTAFSQAGIDFARMTFDITKCSQQLEDIYDHVVQEHARKSSA
jgi:colanic acid/amylovoran biosynthesis glycosyltransferase